MALSQQSISPSGAISSANEDYIEAILELGGDKQPVKSINLAKHLKVTRSAANQALATLKKLGLVDKSNYGTVILTAEGSRRSAKVLERHHVLTTFLTDVLGVSSKVATTEACQMEHAISDDTLDKLTKHVQSSLQ